MKFLEHQLHGYRHGHQLLSASTKLPKQDQDLIDRLSDVAGPLRPDERFDPYLTCYPLPSRASYVLARTWQDFDAPRAGCVRTRSLLVPMPEWMVGVDIVGLVELLSSTGPMVPAERVRVDQSYHSLPDVDSSEALELVEALFLEDRKPVAVFDASDAEAITFRLLVSLWPSFRRTFAVSTFALSPRTISGHNFDLVFAPRNARSRFSEWPGRKIDAKKAGIARHRWSHEIIDRLFSADRPSLLRDDALGGSIATNGGTVAEFRISLLWNELLGKLETSPNAALGLLDIANSRPTGNFDAIRTLEPALGRAAHSAITSLPPAEAWRFLLALTDKLKDVRLPLSVAKAIRSAAIKLAAASPIDAIANVKMLSVARGYELLLGAVGEGISHDFDTERACAVAKLDPLNFLTLLLLSPSLAVASLTHFPVLLELLTIALLQASAGVIGAAKRRLLRVLVDDRHAVAASFLIAQLNRDELLAETRLLCDANGLTAKKLYEPLVERARAIGGVAELREFVATLPCAQGTDALLLRLVAPIREDMQWLLKSPALANVRRLDLLRRKFRSTPPSEFKSMVVACKHEPVLELLMQDPAGSLDILERFLEHEGIDAQITVDITMRLLPHVDHGRALHFAVRALEIILSRHTGRGHRAAVDTLLGAVGPSLDGSWAIHIALGREVSGELVAENLSAFNRSAPEIRQRIMLAIDHLALSIVSRGKIDYAEHAVADAASLHWDSAILDQQAFVRSSFTLMPFLLKSYQQPASPLIASVFPPVYEELKKVDATRDFYKLFVFFDGDRCKTARNDLIDAFMRSNWRATDIAVAAARSGDTAKILRGILTRHDGKRAILEIERNLSLIPNPWHREVSQALQELRHVR